MNRKKMPLILMLVAGAVAWIITFVQKYSVLDSLIAVFVSLVIFYFLGSVMRWILDYFDIQNEKRRQEELEASEGNAGNTAGEQAATEA